MEPSLPQEKGEKMILENTSNLFTTFKGNIFLILIVLIIVLGLSAGIYLWMQQTNTTKISDIPKKVSLELKEESVQYVKPLIPLPKEVSEGQPLKPDTVMAKVGKEQIYKSDLDAEMAYAASGKSNSPVAVNNLLDKIIEDSILLQESKSKIQLTPDIYNSPNKNYLKRAETVSSLRLAKEKEINQNTSGKSGTILAIWYLNGHPGKFGFEESRKIALQKITDLKNQVESRSLTIKQAADKIKNDVSLADLDYNYKGNADIDFKITGPEQKIIPDKEISKELWSLDKNSITKIYPIRVSNNEEFFAFGQVTGISNTGSFNSYNDWLSAKEKEYKIEKY